MQDSTTIAITIPIKSTQNYKNLVEDCVRSVVNNIVNPTPFPTSKQNSKQNHPEVVTPFDDITVKLIDEPIAVAAAYALRLNIHSKGNVALVFCMGAGYLQVAAYFIQQVVFMRASNSSCKFRKLTTGLI